ncbi:hypothetical protein B0T17DRAFT_498062 [Bombardia bombarda]|uniref:Zn(2)-C6 fungal-type domain-containing protein n=1 Tax=Bombardia bombarda TaxID=252184 RepID=A0AA39WGW1_9PEZI|nr:hypothetical protein B0T17DRAFT_498062 [Bombardia bombarda]
MPGYDARNWSYSDPGQLAFSAPSGREFDVLLGRGIDRYSDLPVAPAAPNVHPVAQSAKPHQHQQVSLSFVHRVQPTGAKISSKEGVSASGSSPSAIDRSEESSFAVHRSETPVSSVSRGTTTDVSSWLVPTPNPPPKALPLLAYGPPPPLKSLPKRGPTSHGSSRDADDEFVVSSEEIEAAATNVPRLGPCSRVWTLPPKVKPDDGTPSKRKRDSHDVAKDGPKRRGAYTDELMKRNTALTRILKSCIRCRMNRGRCNPDPEEPNGPCLTCKGITGPTLSKMPCYRYIVTDASLYREQKAPYQLFTKRWQSMDIVDIPASGWASPDIRTIEVANYVGASFRIHVKEFIPVEGDILEEVWMTSHGMQKVPIPRYAVADMQQTADEMKGFIERNVSNFINMTVGDLDQLLWETYNMAFRHLGNAQVCCEHTLEERNLLCNTFRLWVTCRLISNSVHICSEEKLGGQPIYAPGTSQHGKVSMPLIMTAQFECINYTAFLRPWSKAILKQLNELVLAKKREYWLTIYFTMFVLLHSCAMITRRDAEFARQFDMKNQYANPESIRAHHSGVQTMLAHFHYINKGVIPFSLPHTEAGKQELAKAANLTDEQVKFVWKTSDMTNEPRRAAYMKYIRERDEVGDDLYWVSMLYDKDWKPRSND